MADTHQEYPHTPSQPPRPPPPQAYGRQPPWPPPRRGFSILGSCFALIFLCIAAIVIFGFGFAAGWFSTNSEGTATLHERFHNGNSSSGNKVAVVKIDGVLIEGGISYAEKQIEQAMHDSSVKAVVVRIDSPGGSITASEELYRRLIKLRDGENGNPPRPLVVSMGGLAASGGYYVAMPAKKIFAEPTTTTGSIGVYLALPNVQKGASQIGIQLQVIRDGDLKDSGSPFNEPMKKDSKEYQVWQNMIDHAYLQFIDVVEKGRPELKGKLQETVELNETLPIRSGDETQRTYALKRYRADGGIFTAEQAKQFGLVDDIGTLEEAAEAAAKDANLGSDYKVVAYEKPPTLMGILFGVKAPKAPMQLDAARLADAATPRLWYLASQSELAGFVALTGEK